MIFHGLIIKNVALDYPLKFLTSILKRGNLGVEVFLFLSGICLYYSMSCDSRIRIFYKKRLKRIVFPYLTIAGIFWFIKHVLSQGHLLSFIKQITFYNFWINGNSSEWFIALIFPLYIVYPFIYKKLLKTNKRFLLLVLILIVYAFLTILRIHYNVYYGKVEIALSRIPIFLLGCFFGKTVFENGEIKKTYLYGWIFLTILVWLGFYFKLYSLTKIHRLPYFFAGPLVCVLFCFIFEKIEQAGWTKSFIMLNYAGTISLELYLSHLILRRFFIASKYYSNYPPANFHEYVILVIGGAICISIIVRFLSNKIFVK